MRQFLGDFKKNQASDMFLCEFDDLNTLITLSNKVVTDLKFSDGNELLLLPRAYSTKCDGAVLSFA